MERLSDAQIAAWNDVLNNVRKAEARLSSPYNEPFYRGHSKQQYKLLPGLLREGVAVDIEADLFQIFRIRAASKIGPSKTSWEILTMMQHHSVPTRLLDWTEVFGIALYFALLDSPESPCIWVMDPFDLTKRSANESMIYTLGLDTLPDYYHSFVKKKNWPFDLPIVVEAPWAHDRIYAQKGFFTVHGNSEDAIEDSCPECVERIDIPPEAIPGATEFLERAGIDAYSLFPDLGGLATWLKSNYC